MTKTSRKAFTLVELLVVIAIIGLLSTVAVVALNSARQKARNTKRGADLRQLVTAFNAALNTSSSGTYPSTGGDVWVCVSSSCFAGWSGYTANATVDSFLVPFMPTKPVDPAEGGRGYGGYIYDGGFGGGTGSGGDIFPAGPTLNYLLEQPASGCPVGKLWDNKPNYYECLISLSQT